MLEIVVPIQILCAIFSAAKLLPHKPVTQPDVADLSRLILRLLNAASVN